MAQENNLLNELTGAAFELGHDLAKRVLKYLVADTGAVKAEYSANASAFAGVFETLIGRRSCF